VAQGQLAVQELWQLYSDQGVALVGKGATKDNAFGKGLLHGASHVWIWRKTSGGVEVLLQKRAANKRTWPNRFDISAAGHIDLGEDPLTAALREAKEEINLDIDETDLQLIGVHRAHLKADSGDVENEFQWLYLLELPSETEFIMQENEVAALEWKTFESFKQETGLNSKFYVPHGKVYYDTIIRAVEIIQ
jgi:isopentenyldiphosphate isomerase